MASAAERRRAQRELAKQLKRGKTPIGNIARQARKTAERTRNRPIFDSDILKARVKQKKREFWDALIIFNARNSDNNVEESDALNEMQEFLDDFDIESASEYASQASLAHISITRYGDAGNLDIYLPFDFLFYH